MELKHESNPIDQAGIVRQVVYNLYQGWGYNFYRAENQLRADDQLIRNHLSDILSGLRAHVAKVESNFREEAMPTPTREKPFPDAADVKTAQRLVKVQQDLEALEVAVRNAAAPERDRNMQRHVNERDALERLQEFDLQLGALVVAMRDMLSSVTDPHALLDAWNTDTVKAALPRLLEDRKRIYEAIG